MRKQLTSGFKLKILENSRERGGAQAPLGRGSTTTVWRRGTILGMRRRWMRRTAQQPGGRHL